MAKIEKFNRGFLLSRKGCELDAQISTIFVGKGCANFVQLFFLPCQKKDRQNQKRTAKSYKAFDRMNTETKCSFISRYT